MKNLSVRNQSIPDLTFCILDEDSLRICRMEGYSHNQQVQPLRVIKHHSQRSTLFLDVVVRKDDEIENQDHLSIITFTG